MRLIGVCGPAGSGKTTFAQYISKKYNYTPYALADPIKEIGRIFGFTNRELYGTQEDKLKVNPFLGVCAREFLQRFGTDICRDSLPHLLPSMHLETYGIWIQLFGKFLEENKQKSIVVHDVRFDDEAMYIKARGGYIVQLHGTPDENSFSSHVSEQGICPSLVDVPIPNMKTLDEFYNEIDKLMDTLKND